MSCSIRSALSSAAQVWIYRSTLHLIPLSIHSPRPPVAASVTAPTDADTAVDDPQHEIWLSEEDAVRAVRDPKVRTEADNDLQNAAFARLEE